MSIISSTHVVAIEEDLLDLKLVDCSNGQLVFTIEDGDSLVTFSVNSKAGLQLSYFINSNIEDAERQGLL